MSKSLQELPCVILCGGKSSRMGEDKALLPFSSYTSLAQYQVERLKPYFKSVQLSSKTNKFDFHCDIIYDTEKISSPLIALKTIFNTLEDEKVFIMTVDTPFVSLGTIGKLYASSKNFDITVAQSLRTHNLCGVFSKSILEKIVEMVDDDFHKIGALLKRVNTSYVKFDDENEFLNLNTQDEYKLALKYYKSDEIEIMVTNTGMSILNNWLSSLTEENQSTLFKENCEKYVLFNLESKLRNNRLVLSNDEALVLFEWLGNFNDEDRTEYYNNENIEQLLYDLECSLESTLVCVFSPDYKVIVTNARTNLNKMMLTQ